ncbi:AAA family ATPase [Kineosporia sp. J2-2]|uniref:AAA family ATPase n=1 Tax=Kineosporia corallincola TaxID=2835133 RepID=A0ABS5TC07_9ACTN|nr:LuxR family transcriptional regulator [Kineosporia corallincola]MBT0768617.1 AAA family ATPase [Kineosporia corallincola]
MEHTGRDLVGRLREQARITALVDGRGPGRLLLRGPAGIGKTVLLRRAAALAGTHGLRVLRASGVEAEQYLPFAALHQVLLPTLGHLGDLPQLPRTALARAFALLPAADTPDPLHVGLAALGLLTGGDGRATLLVLDDLHWMDDASRAAIRFVWQRAGASPRIVAASREDDPGWCREATETIALTPLDRDQARELALRTAPGLGPQALHHLLGLAAGNPLALVELPQAATELADSSVLPVQTRLERAFAARFGPLDAAARMLLTVAAVHESPLVTDVLAAGRELVEDSHAPGALRRALDSGLVGASGARLVFLHPLVRSALVRAAGPDLLAQVHQAVADTTHDRFASVWHRAHATAKPDEDVAEALERVAGEARSRGALRPARSALIRAAALSVDDRRHVHRLLDAAQIADELGEPDAVERLVAQARALGPDETSAARIALLDGGTDDHVVLRVERLLHRAGAALAGDAHDLAADLLCRASRLMDHGAILDTSHRERVLTAAGALTLPSHDPRLLLIRACLSPAGPGVPVGLAGAATTGVLDPGQDALLAQAAVAGGDWDSVPALTARAAGGLRRQGRTALLAETLAARAFAAVMVGRWDDVDDVAVRAGRLAEETGQARWRHDAGLTRALLAALRGESERVAELLADGERFAVVTGDAVLGDTARLARGLAHLGADRHLDAYEALRSRVTTVPHPNRRLWAVDLLAEAAVGAGRAREAWELLRADLENAPPGPAAQVRSRNLARALLARPEEMEDAFGAAVLEARGTPGWHRARLDLYHGMWLRRHRRAAEARAVLEPCVLVLDRLGARAWAARGRRELAATGRRSRPASGISLTAQELRIARLAAEGLSNKEIGLRLFLTHRTVGTHLYRVFPKLNVRTRGQLHRVMREAGLLDD